MPAWKITAKPKNGGADKVFEVSNTSTDPKAVQAEFERTHGKLLEVVSVIDPSEPVKEAKK